MGTFYFNLTDAEMNKVMESIYGLLLTDKIFLDPELTIKSLSKRTHIHENIVSFIINDKRDSNISNFINIYRVNNFIELVSSNRMASETILSIAYESGFNSKSNFNRIFRAIKNSTSTE